MLNLKLEAKSRLAKNFFSSVKKEIIYCIIFGTIVAILCIFISDIILFLQILRVPFLNPRLVINSDFTRKSNPMSDLGSGASHSANSFNEACEIFFFYMKYLISFILIAIGFLTLFHVRFKEKDHHVSLGLVYLIIGFGFLFDILIFFLIWMLNPLPDRIIFNFLNFKSDFNPFYENNIEDLKHSETPYVVSVYYIFAIISFFSLIAILTSLWHIIFTDKDKYKSDFSMLISGIIGCFLCGFTTCLPLLLTN